MDPITIAMGLAQFAPAIIKWVTGSDKAESAATKVVEIAQTVTGTASGPEALAALRASADKQLEFQQKVMATEMELDKLYLNDIANARARDIARAAGGRHNVRADSMYVLAVIVIVWLVYIVWDAQDINEYVRGVVTLVLGRFLGYLDGIYNFEFGTTRSSKSKDTTIEQLSKK